MERMGVVETKRGQGTFVVEKQELVFELKRSMQQDIIDQFVSNMKDLGFTKNEMIESLQEFLDGGDEN
jgi:GntR family transcriptional regulator